ncbi:bifunctional glycosyltransferase/CDP-glycerol:glycerophosphate glycerophosphotransferase [Actinospica robiniae]|uniref:bifunctional glycosyltransferase/CDP-glycerol:glycerophosphate glycerophosphotransferase n=1 Tax=Actinospica robiniae TaxID=304901 RepID=UPI0004052E61|nr:bifunctional glycosyltransferase family 2 protein/CDP-glycerol:glycerophosphate glycerophosphotransferase [Actinospica robiniae]
MTREFDSPRLTVVVPIYNVERYLAECLSSVEAQSFPDFECVMVDDGATDSSAAIARSFSLRDPRFRLISQANAGLGAARNAGVRAAHPESEFLVFLDSDDTVPNYAYKLMVDTALETGSEIVSGNVQTFTVSGGAQQSPMHRNIMKSTRLTTHISRDRSLFYDRLAPNKLFRFDFWREHGFRFPEGVLYEDSPLTLPAHFEAKQVSVLATSVYNWRQREPGEQLSITQRRFEPKAVRDRVSAVDSFSRYLAKRTLEDKKFREHKAYYDKIGLTSEINVFLKLLPEGDAEFRTAFLESARHFVGQVDKETLERLPALMRLKWHLIGRGLMPELLQVLAYEAKKEVMPVVRGLRHRYANYPFFEDKALDVPKSVYQVDRELKLKSRVDSVVWRDGKIVLGGYSLLQCVNVHEKRMSVKMIALRWGKSRKLVPLMTHTVHRPDVTAESGQPRYCYDWAGFETVIDPERLKVDGQWREGTWRAALVLHTRGLTRKGLLNAELLKDGKQPRPLYLDGDVCIVPNIGTGSFEVRVEKIKAWYESIRLEGDRIVFTGRLRADLGEGAALRLRRSQGDGVQSGPIELGPLGADGWRQFTAAVPIPGLFENLGLSAADPGDHGHGWFVLLESADASTVVRGRLKPGVADACLPLDPRLAPTTKAWEIAPFRTNSDELNVHVRTVRPIITAVEAGADGGFRLRGHFPVEEPAALEMVLAIRGHVEEHVFPARRVGEYGFEAEATPTAIRSLAGVLPLPSGVWDVRLRPVGSNEPGLPVKLGEAVRDSGLPAPAEVLGRAYTLRVALSDHLALVVRSDLAPDEIGPYSQYRLRQRVYEPAMQQPLRAAVLYDSYTGKQYSDSPRAVHERLVELGADVEHLWVVRDAQVEVPPTAKRVRMWSADWFDALARSRYIVTNAHLPHWIKSREGQVVVQAWHGTPLKKIGHDIENVAFSDGYLDRVAQESKSWSFIVSPNSFSTPILKRAFNYDGEMLESGYPRNDLLYGADRDERAAEIRRTIGIPEGRKVALYAPTWRDDKFYSPGRFKLDMQIDLEDARRRLGGEYVLLVRRHPNIVDTVPHAGNGFVFDVSKYPDVGELFLASDVLITDYSSLMFDYAHLERPMLFFTYDLEHYRDTLRGFYFDFQEQSPGPLLSTSDELVDALARIDEVAHAYAQRAREFRKMFCDLDDGHAALRVIKRMGELSGSPLVAGVAELVAV